MLKKYSKFLLLFLLIFITLSSSLTCLAEEEHDHNHEETDTTVDENAIHSGDLYLFGNDVVMNQYVDGSVFVLANHATIAGQINGSLYILANNVNFDNALVRHSIYVCGNNVYYNNSGTYENESDAYFLANTLTTTYSSYVSRNVKILASDVTFKSGIGKDADIICNKLNLGEGEDVPVIYGDLRYTANNEITIPEGAVQGTVSYSKQYAGNSVTGILMGFVTCIVTVLALFIILNKLIPCFIQKVSDTNLSILKLLKTFGIGLATIAIVVVFIVLLVGTIAGMLLGIILGLLFAILFIIATPTLAIKIANTLKTALKLEKNYMFLLILTLVTIILYGITLIPFVGIIFSFLINVTSIGLIANVFLPHKELSEEEKNALEEAKKLNKENKEKLKQEKNELKAAKKQKNESKKIKQTSKATNKKDKKK